MYAKSKRLSRFALRRLLYQIRLKTSILFAQKNEKLGKGLCEISRCRAKSHTTKRVTFRSAEGQRESKLADLVLIVEDLADLGQVRAFSNG
jgi:hypothetical protein